MLFRSVAELTFGASYDFSEHFSAGLEFFGAKEFYDGGNELSISAGPVAMFSADEWWIAFTAMPNLYASEFDNDQGHSFQSRLIFSYEF